MSKIKIIIQLLFFVVLINFCTPDSAKAQMDLNDFYNRTDLYLAQIVKNGMVDYETAQEKSGQLDTLLTFITSFDTSIINSPDEGKAFWLNTYNLMVIKAIVDSYPTESVLEIPGFFNVTKRNAAGLNLTIDQIEKEKIFTIEPDPRIHFALVCGAVSCPALLNESFKPGILESQLEKVTADFINDEKYVRVDSLAKMIYVSKIFYWYISDFISGDDSLHTYLNSYRTNKLPERFNIDYRRYNWRLNDSDYKEQISNSATKNSLQNFTPSVLLTDGQFEIKVFNNLYSQTKGFDDNGKKVDYGERSSFFTSLISLLYGYSEDVNFGFELWFRSVRYDDPDSPPLKVLTFGNDQSSRTTVSRLGPRVKFAPFEGSVSTKLSIQSTFLFATASDLDGSESSSRPYLDEDAHVWINQFFFDSRLTEKLSYFGEIDTWFWIDRDLNGSRNRLQIPLKSFLSYYPSSDWTLYGMFEFLYHWSATGRNETVTGFYLQAGLGMKYQFIPNFEMEVLFTDFLFGRNTGAGGTGNLGLRFIF